MFDKYEDWVHSSNYFVRPNVSYLLDKIVVVYWLNIESIWGLIIGGYWQGSGANRTYILANNPTVTGVPSVPDGERMMTLNDFAQGVSNATEIAKFNISNVTSSINTFSGLSKLKTVFDNNEIKSNTIVSASSMFYGCSDLEKLTLEFPNCIQFSHLASGCSKLEDFKLLCDNGSYFEQAFRGIKMPLENILNPTAPYFNFNKAKYLSQAFQDMTTYQNLTVDLNSKFPLAVDMKRMFDGLNFRTQTNPGVNTDINISGFSDISSSLLANIKAFDSNNNQTYFNKIKYTLSANSSMYDNIRGEFQGLKLRYFEIDENGFHVTSWRSAFNSTDGLWEFPQVPTGYADNINEMFSNAIVYIPDNPSYVCPAVYDVGNCTKLDSVFYNVKINSQTLNPAPYSSNAYPSFVNTQNIVSAISTFRRNEMSGTWSKNLTSNKCEYINTFDNCNNLVTFDNSVKFNVYKTMTSFIASDRNINNSFTADGYNTPIDVWMKNSPSDTNNTISLNNLFSECNNLVTSPIINIWYEGSIPINAASVKAGLIPNSIKVDTGGLMSSDGTTSNSKPELTTWRGDFVTVGAGASSADAPFYSYYFTQPLKNINFGLVRGAYNLRNTPDLTLASMISFIKAFTPANPANTHFEYAGTGLDNYISETPIYITQKQYDGDYTTPGVSDTIPGTTETIKQFWQSFFVAGGSRLDWGYKIWYPGA